MSCPCGNPLPYEKCCGLYIDDKVLPPDPESLMRSRYTAFVTGNIKYLANTMKGNALKKFNFAGIKSWLNQVEWQGLTVIKSRLKSPTKGYVTFDARYLEANKLHHIHEKSEFKKIAGKWFYVDGKNLS